MDRQVTLPKRVTYLEGVPHLHVKTPSPDASLRRRSEEPELSPSNDISSDKTKQFETVENNFMKDCEIIFFVMYWKNASWSWLAPVCRVGGHEFKPPQDQHSRS